MPATLFISDLHLDKSRPAMVERFLAFLQRDARACDALYILGDLFEVWIGDDHGNHAYADIIDALRGCTSQGTPIHVMHGNRDFLLGPAFASASGCQLLPDPFVVSLDGQPVLLLHGDTLCTDDTDYQQFRSQVRNPEWQQQFLSMTREERSDIAAGLRELSTDATAGKADEIMDVNSNAVRNAFREHQITTMVHGHTHRPGRHQDTVDGNAVEHIVLGDWYEQGSVLRYEDGKFELQNLK